MSEPCDDPDHEYNGPAHHTGCRCITPGCTRPAGTAWSPHWCQHCNAERLRRITKNLDDICANFRKREAPGE